MAKDEVPELPWPYKKLSAEAVAERAYESYFQGACCYGVFASIIGELREVVGSPYTTLPTAMMIYGEGGVAGIGSVCGALNGAAAAIFLIAGAVEKSKREVSAAITRELFNWYAQTPLPDFRPVAAKLEIVKSVSCSNLCHVSVSAWCKASKCKSFSKERTERCGWLTASVAKRTVELLNASLDETFKVTHELSGRAQACVDCHGKGSRLENTRGMMECGGCHFRGELEHPATTLETGS